MSAKRILVVEDNPEERRIYEAYLRFAGGETLAATNGEEGVRVAREARPDLIILDLTMPVLDGWETIRRLQSDPETREIPVIAVTARRLGRSRVAEAGFCGYLEKPVAPFLVLREIERCLGPFDREAASPPEEGSSSRPRPRGN